MNTPAHILISLAAFAKSTWPRNESVNQPNLEVADGLETPRSETNWVWPATIGAVLPDAPMFVFYAIEKWIVGSTEREIWGTRYFLDSWQDFFDLFNSIPICAGLVILCSWRKWHWLTILFGSMVIHCLCDLPLHFDDGHRHFFPLTDWRFQSPVSYWDPKHYGVWAAVGELLISAGCFWLVFKHRRGLVFRAGISILMILYLLMMAGYFTFVLGGYADNL